MAYRYFSLSTNELVVSVPFACNRYHRACTVEAGIFQFLDGSYGGHVACPVCKGRYVVDVVRCWPDWAFRCCVTVTCVDDVKSPMEFATELYEILEPLTTVRVSHKDLVVYTFIPGQARPVFVKKSTESEVKGR